MLNNSHILIVEDEPGIYQFLQEGLEEEGFSVCIATNGLDGLEMVEKEHPNLILLDWMLPRMSGLALCQKIREVDVKTPIIFLTAKDTLDDTIRGLQAGANDYIKKPFSFDELLERIKIHFRSNGVLQLRDISLVASTFKVTQGVNDVALTQLEFKLLKYLIENKEAVCDRDAIIAYVWGHHFKYDTGVIDVYINAIRKKLNINKQTGCIKTVRGVGYIATDIL
jgi:DNA-binding response OmpR family regulator